MNSKIELFITGAMLLVAAVGCNRVGNEGEHTLRDFTQHDGVAVQVTSVQPADIKQNIELVGSFLPRRRTVIVTDVDGVIESIPYSDEKFVVEVGENRRLEELSVDLGQKVKHGDVLVQIDPTDYQLALDVAEAAAEKARMDLADLMEWQRPEDIARLKATRDEAEARFVIGMDELKRVTTLRAKQAVSDSQYDQQKAELASAKAVLDRAEAELAIATNGPTQSEIAVAKAKVLQSEAEVKVRRDKLEKTTIRAPYDAVITDRFVDQGERVTAMPRVEIMEIMDLSLVIVEVGIPEHHIHQVRVRDHVLVEAEGVTDPVSGTVIFVNDKVDTNSRTYRTRVVVDNTGERFKAGQFVSVAFTFDSSSQNLAVPTRSVTYTGGQPQVFVCADGKVALRKVKLGLSDGQHTEILAGLDEGETVVVDDPAVLSDGMKVRLNAGEPAVAQAAGETQMAGGIR